MKMLIKVWEIPVSILIFIIFFYFLYSSTTFKVANEFIAKLIIRAKTQACSFANFYLPSGFQSLWLLVTSNFSIIFQESTSGSWNFWEALLGLDPESLPNLIKTTRKAFRVWFWYSATIFDSTIIIIRYFKQLN